MTTCIDRQPIEVVHYVIVRADLPAGSQVAQTIHAAGESAAMSDVRVAPGSIAVALHARNVDHLLALAEALERAHVARHVVLESDGEPMAIGVLPTTDRDAVRKVLSSLPLVR